MLVDVDGDFPRAVRDSMVKPTNYSVIGVRPDGIVGMKLTCESKERADLFAGLFEKQHPDWNISVRPSGSSATIDIIDPDIELPSVE